VLTGMVPYTSLNVGDPMRFVFEVVNQDWIAGVVAVSAVIATAGVLLVFQLGQPRIWMSMSRDGLLPPVFSKVHPRYKTPSFSTILTGILVGIPALFLNLEVVVDLCSVGTLFAFVMVCGGILALDQKRKKGMNDMPPQGKFRTPFISGRWIVPVLFILTVMLFVTYYPGGAGAFFGATDDTGNFSWTVFREKIPYIGFGLIFAVMAVLSFIKNFSLIPVLGFLCCSYLLCESGTSNWERFLLWLVVGIVIYFTYGYKKSRLRP